jgi:predicted O-methyltransferase YrrM
MPELRALTIPDGTGGVNPGDARAIFYLVCYFRPDSVLEVGTHIGASTVHIAAALRSYQNSEPNPTLLSVDAHNVNDPITRPWSMHGTKFSPAEMINLLGCDHLVEFVTQPSPDYLNSSVRGADFVFLDGDHTAHTVYREIPAALKLLSKGGLVLLHDYFPEAKPLWRDGAMIPGPFLATERLRAECAQLEVVPLGRLPWPTKLGSNVTSLALLVRKS